jgi:hypothetical protein
MMVGYRVMISLRKWWKERVWALVWWREMARWTQEGQREWALAWLELVQVCQWVMQAWQVLGCLQEQG